MSTDLHGIYARQLGKTRRSSGVRREADTYNQNILPRVGSIYRRRPLYISAYALQQEVVVRPKSWRKFLETDELSDAYGTSNVCR